MQAISNSLSSDQFETLNQKLSEIQNLISGKEETKINAMKNYQPQSQELRSIAIRDAVRGAAVAAVQNRFIHLTENKKQYLFYRSTLENGYTTAEIFSGIFGAFKPFELQIDARNLKNEPKDLEILNLSVLGSPQLMNFDGSTVIENRGNSIFFNKLKSFEFATFGSSVGMGARFEFNNPYDEKINVLITIVGSENSINNISEPQNPIILFKHGICKKGDRKKISVYSGRKTKITPSKLQINILDFEGKKTTINLLDIIHRKVSKFVNFDTVMIPTSFFEDLREINLGEFGGSENQALIFEFENPTNKDVRIYISIEAGETE